MVVVGWNGFCCWGEITWLEDIPKGLVVLGIDVDEFGEVLNKLLDVAAVPDPGNKFWLLVGAEVPNGLVVDVVPIPPKDPVAGVEIPKGLVDAGGFTENKLLFVVDVPIPPNVGDDELDVGKAGVVDEVKGDWEVESPKGFPVVVEFP